MAGENKFHRNLGIIDGIHIPYSWEYADTAAREGASGFLETDEGKFARQTDNNTIWMLVDYSAPTWTPVGGDIVGLAKVSSNDTTAGYLTNKIIVDAGSNSSEILETSEVNDGGDEDLKIQIDPSKIAHSAINDDEASKHRTINDSGSEATDLWSADKIGTELGGKSDTGHTHTESDITDLVHTDTAAIHDNVVGEINAVTEKTTPVADDVIIIEDSNASYAKKRVKISNLPVGVDSDELIKISSNDTTADYLKTKLTTSLDTNSGYAIELKEIDDGGNETLNIAFDQGKINHSQIYACGTYTHAQIDSHIINTNNPHGVNKADVGLGNVHDYSQVRKLDSCTDEAILRWDGTLGHTVQDSLATIDDSGSINIPTGQLYKINGAQHTHTEANISDLDHNDTYAIHDNIANEISALSEKTVVHDNDLVIIEDSEAAYAKKKVKASNLPGSGGGGFKEYHFDAVSLYTPCNSDWPVGNIHAELNLDTVDPGLYVRKFGDGANDGVGFLIEVPTGATNIVFNIKNRAQDAPGTTKAVVLKLFHRQIVEGSAVPSWSSGFNMNTISMPTNAYWKNSNDSLSLSSLSITAGRVVQFELTRDYTHASDTLVGYWLLLHMKISFT